MNTPPLQLGKYNFTQVNITAQQNAKPEDFNRVEFGVMASAVPRSEGSVQEWCVFVLVEFKPKDGAFPAYLGKVEAFGLFSVADSWPKDQVEQLVFVNGGGILYAAIREMIYMVTSRCVYENALTIPSYSFIDLYKEWKEAIQKGNNKTVESAPQTPTPATP
jgi:preprotein translocase subunit SecB